MCSFFIFLKVNKRSRFGIVGTFVEFNSIIVHHLYKTVVSARIQNHTCVHLLINPVNFRICEEMILTNVYADVWQCLPLWFSCFSRLVLLEVLLVE